MFLGRYFVICFLFLGVGCVSTNSGGIGEEDVTSEPKRNTPQIVFLQYNFYLSDDQDMGATFLKKIVTEGTIKDLGDSLDDAELQIRQLNAEKQMVSSLNIDNPLVEEVEYVNENRELEKKIVKHQEKEAFYRLQLYPETNYIEIVHFEDGKENSLSLTKF